MHTQGFERLIRKMDEIAGKTEEEVIIQIGHTKYTPQNAKYFEFITGEELKELCRKARVVVTHGAMTIIDALEQGTPVIAVPRLKRYNEHINDHQLYFVQELERTGKIIAVYDANELEETIKTVGARPARFVREKRLVEALKGYVAQFERG